MGGLLSEARLRSAHFRRLREANGRGVVFATPGRADDALVAALAGSAPELHAIGDCYTPRDVEAAILEGHRIGRAL